MLYFKTGTIISKTLSTNRDVLFQNRNYHFKDTLCQQLIEGVRDGVRDDIVCIIWVYEYI